MFLQPRVPHEQLLLFFVGGDLSEKFVVRVTGMPPWHEGRNNMVIWIRTKCDKRRRWGHDWVSERNVSKQIVTSVWNDDSNSNQIFVLVNFVCLCPVQIVLAHCLSDFGGIKESHSKK